MRHGAQLSFQETRASEQSFLAQVLKVLTAYTLRMELYWY